MGNNASKTEIEIKNTQCDIKEKNLNHKKNKTDKNSENNNDKNITNNENEKKAKDRDKKLSKEKRKHYLNRLTFINRRETFVENNFIPRSSFGACSFYDENNNLFEYEPDFSNNFENLKFSNSFVDDYNPNNEYINNYLNSHKINESSSLNTSSINFVKARKSRIEKTISIGMRNSVSEDNLVLINGVKKLNKGNLNFECFDYGNNIIDNNINGVNNYNNNNYICNRSCRNSELQNNFNIQEAKTTFGYEHSDKRLSVSNTDFNSFKGIYNDNYFENSFIERQSYRKNRKTIISNLIHNSIALRKNYEKEEKSLNSISQNDSLNEHSINNAQIFSSKHEDNKIFEEKFNSKVKIEENAFSYAETRNSLFLDLKNQEFFFDNQSSNNLANNSYSDIRSTSDTKLFDIAKPRAKTPNREVKTSESDISIIKSNKSETKTIDFLSKSYEVFDINKKQEDVFSSEISMENNSDKDNSSFDKNCKKSISFEYEKVDKTNSLNKSNFEIKEDLNNMDPFSYKIAKNNEASLSFKSSEYLKQRKYYSNINIAQVKSTKEFLLNNKNINSLIDKNNSSNDIITNYKNELNGSNGETNHYPFRFRKSIISNLHALNKSSNKIYNNLSKNTFKLEFNNLNNSYFYSSNRTIKSNSDNSIINNSDTNSTSFRMTIGNNSTFNNRSIQNNHNISKFSNEELYDEYKLNYYRVKHSENLRKNYIAKLIYKQIWQPSKKVKNHNSLILFDWDDTLLCTSFLTPNGVYREDLKLSDKDLEKLAKLEFSVLRLLTIAVEKGDVYIITNAAPGWVEYSAEKYYPSLKTIIKKIKIVSARGEYEKEYPGDSRMWKIQAFLNMQKDFDPGLITNIICLGDSFIEMEAAQILAGKFSKAFIKSVKFRESPKPEELNKQLTLVADQFLSIYSTIKNLTIRVERKLRK